MYNKRSLETLESCSPYQIIRAANHIPRSYKNIWITCPYALTLDLPNNYFEMPLFL